MTDRAGAALGAIQAVLERRAIARRGRRRDVEFSVDRNGRVLAHEIVRSSGHPELDKEVISTIERAQPLPAFPPSMPEEKLDLTVPIRFSLR
jgi:TonB family protein